MSRRRTGNCTKGYFISRDWKTEEDNPFITSVLFKLFTANTESEIIRIILSINNS